MRLILVIYKMQEVHILMNLDEYLETNRDMLMNIRALDGEIVKINTGL